MHSLSMFLPLQKKGRLFIFYSDNHSVVKYVNHKMYTKGSSYHSNSELVQSRGHSHNHVLFFDESSMNNYHLKEIPAAQHCMPIMFFDELSVINHQLKWIQATKHSSPIIVVLGDIHLFPGQLYSLCCRVKQTTHLILHLVTHNDKSRNHGGHC